MTKISVPGFSVLRAPFQKKITRAVSTPISKIYPGQIVGSGMESYQLIREYRRFVFGDQFPLFGVDGSKLRGEGELMAEIRLSGVVQGVGMRGTLERIIVGLLGDFQSMNLKKANCPRNESDGSVSLSIEAYPYELLALSRFIRSGLGYHLIAGTDQEAEQGRAVVVGKGGLVPDSARIVWTSSIKRVDWKIFDKTEGGAELSFEQFLEIQKKRINVDSVIGKILRRPVRLHLTPLELLLSQILENRDFNYRFSERQMIQSEEAPGECCPQTQSADAPMWEYRSSIDEEWNHLRANALMVLINSAKAGSSQARKALAKITEKDKDLFVFSQNSDNLRRLPRLETMGANTTTNDLLAAQALRYFTK